MPLSIMLAHKLNAAMAAARRDGSLGWLRPDSKTQVTVEYKKDGGATIPVRVDSVVISTQHAEEITTEDLRAELLEKIVKKVIPANLLDDHTVYHVSSTSLSVSRSTRPKPARANENLSPYRCNPPVDSLSVDLRVRSLSLHLSSFFLLLASLTFLASFLFSLSGDAGLTGRKIIVDTYGGWGAHGGGAFSGKDWSKVDRSAAYTARWIGTCLFLPLFVLDLVQLLISTSSFSSLIAKSLIAAGLARRILVQLSYAIGVAEPLSIFVDSYGTSRHSDEDLVAVINQNFNLRPGVIGSFRFSDFRVWAIVEVSR